MRRMLVLAVASVLLVACATDDDAGANRVVDEAREPASGDTAPSDGETAAQAPTATEGATGSVDDTAGATSGTDGDVVTDLTVARPGSWPVGDAAP